MLRRCSMDNMKIDWVRKLTSRKFWLAIANFVTMMVVAFGGSENQATQIAGIIMAGATVIAYIIGEGLNDAAYNHTNLTITPDVIKEMKELEESER